MEVCMKRKIVTLACQIIGIASSIIAIAGICLAFMFVGQTYHQLFLHGVLLTTICIPVSSAALAMSFKLKTKDEHKEIHQEPESKDHRVSVIVLKIKCFHCQELIDIDSKYCKYCGKKQ
jgi:hypothetical protein